MLSFIKPRSGIDGKNGDQKDLHKRGLLVCRGVGGIFGVSSVEHRLQTAVDRRDGWIIRCYGTMGSGHTYNVPSGLLENMVKGTEVLPGHRRHLLRVVHRGVHLFPLCRHLPQTISQRSHQSVPVMCVELHEFKVGISAGPIFSSISQRICRHRHPQ